MLLLLLLAVSALAQEGVVALLPMDGAPGTDSARMERFVQGLSVGIASSGHLSPLLGRALTERLTEGQEARLDEARAALHEGSTLLREGDADLALPFLEEGIRAHLDAGSAVVRREDLADAHAALARALVLLGDEDDARAHLAEAMRLVPDYALPALPGLEAAAREQLAGRPPRQLSEDGAVVLAVDLGVAFLAHGVVREGGDLDLVVYEGPQRLHTATRPGPFAPPEVGDRFYEVLAAEVVAACRHQPIPVVEVPAHPPVPPEAPPPAPVEDTARPAGRSGLWAAWVVAGVVVAGTGAALVLVRPDEPEPESTWTLEVQPP